MNVFLTFFQGSDQNPEIRCPTGFFIPDELMLRHTNDVEYISHLRDATLTCTSW
jgi:hypothetical protein